MKKYLFSLFCLSTLFAAPQAVVFDYGGVLTGVPNRDIVIEFLCKTFGFTKADFEKINEEKKQIVSSGKSDFEFWQEYANKHNITLPSNWKEQLHNEMKRAFALNEEMFALVHELKEKKIRVALLSNIPAHAAKLLKDFGYYAPFEPCLLSCELGLEKPDPEIYKILLNRLSLPAKQVVYIDDSKENIQAAANLGIDTILFTSKEQLCQELKKRGLL